MNLREVLEGRGGGLRVEDCLSLLETASAVAEKAVINIRSEERMPEEFWLDFIDSIILANPDVSECKMAIVNTCRRWILSGVDAATGGTRAYGRAVETEKFAFFLHAEYIAGVSHLPFYRVLEQIAGVIGVPAEACRIWADVPLGRFLMWSTFDQDRAGGDPFVGTPRTATGTCGLLGLPKRFKQPLLLFTYQIPKSITPKVPTIADAYAGEDWNYYFQVTPSRLDGTPPPWGLTVPWYEYRHWPPKPELVHEPVEGRYLTDLRQRYG